MKKVITFILLSIILISLAGCEKGHCLKSGCQNECEPGEEYCYEHTEVGAHDDLAKAKKKELSEKEKEINPSKDETTIVYKVYSSGERKNAFDITKEMLKLRLENMGYDNAKVKRKNSDEIEVVVQARVNTEDFAKSLINKTDFKFTDYNGNVLLTGDDIESADEKRNTDNNSYYILLKLTKDGKDKFKKATSDISKIPGPNNYINIVIDDLIIASPMVSQKIEDDFCIVSGDFSQKEAKNLETQINFAINNANIEILKIQ